MPFHEIVLKDWATFVRCIDTTEAEDLTPLVQSSYIFRGQANASWPLRPALLRRVADLDAVAALWIERGASESFRLHVHQHLDVATIQLAVGAISWWSLMQHYGAPTRLLDWSGSAYVAAYFAVDREPDEPGAVWAVHARTVNDHSGPLPENRYDLDALLLDPKAAPKVFHVRRSTETPRMAAQQTSFLVSPNILADHGEVLATLPAPPGKALFLKFIIPAALKPYFLRRLRRMNITAQTLFPGVDGLGRSIAELVYLAAHHRIQSMRKEASEPRPSRGEPPAPDDPRKESA